MFDEMNQNQTAEQGNVQSDATEATVTQGGVMQDDAMQGEANPYLAGGQKKITPIQNKPKKNPAVAIVIALAVVVVVLIIAIVALVFSGVFGDKKTKLAKAMTVTFTESGDYLKEAWGADQYEGMFEDKEYSLEADLALPEGISLEMSCDANEDASDLYVDIAMAGSSMVELEGYFDGSQMLIAIPNMLDYVFAINMDTIEEDIWVMVDNGLIDEYTAEDAIEALNTTETDEISEEAAEQLGEDLLEAWKKFYDSVEVEEIESEELTVNGEKQKCKGYAVVVTGEQAATLMEDVINVIEDNDEAKDAFVSAVKANGMDYDEAMSEFEDALDDMRDSEEELEVDIYLYDEKVAQIYWEDDDDDFSFTWDIEGGNFPLENTSIKVESDYDGNFEIIRTGSMDESDYCSEYEIIDEYGTSYVIDTCYNTENGEVSIEFSEDGESSIYVAGSMAKEDDSTIEIAIDTIQVEEEEILSGDITIMNECGDIVKPEGEVKNALTMTMEEWENIVMEAYMSMY